jgi:hypothetical protein
MGGHGESGITLREVIREIPVVPQTNLATELLQEFQDRLRPAFRLLLTTLQNRAQRDQAPTQLRRVRATQGRVICR